MSAPRCNAKHNGVQCYRSQHLIFTRHVKWHSYLGWRSWFSWDLSGSVYGMTTSKIEELAKREPNGVLDRRRDRGHV